MTAFYYRKSSAISTFQEMLTYWVTLKCCRVSQGMRGSWSSSELTSTPGWDMISDMAILSELKMMKFIFHTVSICILWSDETLLLSRFFVSNKRNIEISCVWSDLAFCHGRSCSVGFEAVKWTDTADWWTVLVYGYGLPLQFERSIVFNCVVDVQTHLISLN